MSNNQIPGTPERFTLTGADPTTIPEPSQISGVTMTAAAGEKNVTINSALDTGQLAVGDSLWDNTNFERREVEQISYDRTSTDETYVRLKTAFTNAQSDDDVYVVKNRYYREVGIRSSGNTFTVDGVAGDSDFPFNWHDNAGLRPIDVDPNDETVTVTAKR